MLISYSEKKNEITLFSMFLMATDPYAFAVLAAESGWLAFMTKSRVKLMLRVKLIISKL